MSLINEIKVGDIVLFNAPKCPNNYGKVLRIYKVVDSEIISEPKDSLVFVVEDLFNPGVTYPANIPQEYIKKFYRGTIVNPINEAAGD